MIRRMIFTVVALFGLAASCAFAQTGPVDGGNGAPAPNVVPTQPQAPAVNPSQGPAVNPAGPYLTDVVLQDYLRKLDPAFRTFKGDGRTTYQITIKHKNMTVPMNVDVNNGYIWLEIALGQPKDLGTMPSDLVTRLLQTHTQIGPTVLAIKQFNNGPMLYLLHRVDRSITSERLQAALQEFLGDLDTTEALRVAIVRS